MRRTKGIKKITKVISRGPDLKKYLSNQSITRIPYKPLSK